MLENAVPLGTPLVRRARGYRIEGRSHFHCGWLAGLHSVNKRSKDVNWRHSSRGSLCSACRHYIIIDIMIHWSVLLQQTGNLIETATRRSLKSGLELSLSSPTLLSISSISPSLPRYRNALSVLSLNDVLSTLVIQLTRN